MAEPGTEEKVAVETGDKGSTEEPKEEEATTKTSEAAPTNETTGEKRAAEEDGENDEKTSKPASPKKAKIAMPPPVSDNIMNVDKYTLDSPPPPEKSESEEEIAKKITSPCLILFGLHPLIREPPLRKMCEDFGKIKDMTVRSAFANRYGHVEFETVEEARVCYKALHNGKLLHKAIMVQPSKPQPKSNDNDEAEKTEESKET
ncbi:MAG: hypothetical protein SGILL_007140 [Bacillariaceae sp.]